jgi:hypothetical protein
LPISLVIVTNPPDCLAKLATLLSPSPVPFPGSLVVKNGSVARFSCSGVMPMPVSTTASAT